MDSDLSRFSIPSFAIFTFNFAAIFNDFYNFLKFNFEEKSTVTYLLRKAFCKSFTMQSAENRRKECHRLWLRSHNVVIMISNVGTSASKKINLMALNRTLTV